jgi:hypothetical protein
MSDQSIIFQDGSSTISDKVARVGNHSFPIGDIKGVSSEGIDHLDSWKYFIPALVVLYILVEKFLVAPLKPFLLDWVPFFASFQDLVPVILSVAIIFVAGLLGIGTVTRLTLHTTVGPVMVLETKEKAVVDRIQTAIETSMSRR